ncbi:MAG: HNH endonuclease signature motif containing protein [Synechococcales bacterium]|nr:HNH endonuclease signature motif containing protein [Synechococcales bacterium]
MTLSEAVRRQVRERACFLCEYCHSLEETSAAPFEIDHILPRSLGGMDELENLALACQRCNGYRYNFTSGVDPETQTSVPLFNPRQQDWAEHFVWTAEGTEIVGLTPVGRATCHRLDLNDAFHNEGAIVRARSYWVRGEWHPPNTDPRQPK